jgi:uncharacterized protein with PQ loop repeat
MGFFGRTPPASCPATRHCAEWARIYLKYCLCSQKEGAALALGLISVISWGLAEVPQIITNYRQKSTEGLSVAFLMTWIVGYAISDVFCSLMRLYILFHMPSAPYMRFISCLNNCTCTDVKRGPPV